MPILIHTVQVFIILFYPKIISISQYVVPLKQQKPHNQQITRL